MIATQPPNPTPKETNMNDPAAMILDSALPYRIDRRRPHLRGEGLLEIPSAVFSEACRITTENPPPGHGPLPPP